MKKLFAFALLGVLVTSFALGAFVPDAQSRPLPGICYLMCNRTTYQLFECCPYEKHGEVDYNCRMVGWCYPK
ncbi:MAG: hypothetical protein JSU74_04805 [Candidatus Zixiibacteriota bacterium]|nr:MAG: hypothetical protein JSU74_04805 [candidate division Zixibacteria bacterium]